MRSRMSVRQFISRLMPGRETLGHFQGFSRCCSVVEDDLTLDPNPFPGIFRYVSERPSVRVEMPCISLSEEGQLLRVTPKYLRASPLCTRQIGLQSGNLEIWPDFE